jgi:hypothetical protein
VLPANDIILDVRQEPAYRFGPETAVLVAIATATGSALTAIINGLFKIIEKKSEKAGSITVLSASGAKIEVHGDAAPQRVAELIQQLGDLDRVRIHVGR